MQSSGSDPREWLGRGFEPVPGKPFGWAFNQEREAIRQHLVKRGRWTGYQLHFKVVAIQERLHRNRPTFRQRHEAWLQRQRDLQTLAPELTREEWQAIAERFAGANDPIGQSILAKARHRARG